MLCSKLSRTITRPGAFNNVAPGREPQRRPAARSQRPPSRGKAWYVSRRARGEPPGICGNLLILRTRMKA
eukprot:2170581-Prymnesium_polylepis.1